MIDDVAMRWFGPQASLDTERAPNLPVEYLPHQSPKSIKADVYHDVYPHSVVVANSVPLQFPKAGVSSERLNGCGHHQQMMPDMSCQCKDKDLSFETMGITRGLDQLQR